MTKRNHKVSEYNYEIPQFENLVYVIMSTGENIRLVARTPCTKLIKLKFNIQFLKIGDNR